MLGFPAWRSLARGSGLEPAQAVDAAVRAIQPRAGAGTLHGRGPLPQPSELF